MAFVSCFLLLHLEYLDSLRSVVDAIKLFFFGGGGNLDFPPNKEIENKIVLVFKPALKYENNEANFKQI